MLNLRELSVNSIFPPGYLHPGANRRCVNTNADISTAMAFSQLSHTFHFINSYRSLWHHARRRAAAFKHSRSGFPAPADGLCSRIWRLPRRKWAWNAYPRRRCPSPPVEASTGHIWPEGSRHRQARQREAKFDLSVANRISWLKVQSTTSSCSPILSLWRGSASPLRGSSAPTPSPRNCRTCLEGVPAPREKIDFYSQTSKEKDQWVYLKISPKNLTLFLFLFLRKAEKAKKHWSRKIQSRIAVSLHRVTNELL